MLTDQKLTAACSETATSPLKGSAPQIVSDRLVLQNSGHSREANGFVSGEKCFTAEGPSPLVNIAIGKVEGLRANTHIHIEDWRTGFLAFRD